MAPFTSILCAVDFTRIAPRVLRHAVGLAGVCGARLTVLTVTDVNPREAEARVSAVLYQVVPPEAPYLTTPSIQVARVALGDPADAILGRAREGIDLVVAGTHSKSELSRWLLGSTSAAILADAACPTLLVPPGDLEIVTLTPEAATLHPGTVLAAVDLAEHNVRQLAIASQLAALAGQPLALMTVVGSGDDETAAEEALRARAAVHGHGPARQDRFIIRQGLVSDQIDRTAVAERAGLVVMGLRGRESGIRGHRATAVLKTRDAMVLAVPAGTV